ncbi:GDSL-type esterase/lipase family protein [Calothrix sp. NIES-3974]|uniref:GDSL-type esterase/lipase family protein n=1 Tax=Calothrix sp. NIES-3974 TaxID=2005462 RepID=UPI000B5E7A50|nr:GDSL-type esterase/lipase family protein [Calothrix sp. NIES-3974]BAZ07956.1 hypothetical protein NIES3974_46240 [Calothrix sp. NIES-3974]
MRDAYLLAAGVLTGMAVPTSTLPGLSLLPQLESPGNSGQQQAQISTSVDIPSSIVPESSTPEFSLPFQPDSTPARLLRNYNYDTSYGNQRSHFRQPASGYELYQQRLMALRNGQIYTRIGEGVGDFAQKANTRQLTYEDWKKLLALEAKAIADGQGNNRLSVMVGDSLSLWFPTHKLPSGKLWLNQGISGDTSGGILKRLAYFDKTRPEAIYVMAGVNDLRRGHSDAVILQNIKSIVQRLRKTHPQAQIIVKSILPTRLPTIPNHRIRGINQQIAKIAEAENASYLNIHAWFVDFEGNLRPELTTDGLHLSHNGYEVWQAAIQQVETRIATSQIEQKRRKLLKEQAETVMRKSQVGNQARM